MRTAGFWPPLMVTRPTPLSCEILGASRVSTRSSTWESGMEFEVKARVSTGESAGLVLRWIGLAVDWRRRQVGWQKALRRVDGGLHLFLGYINIQAEVELQHHDRSATGAGGGHLAQALQFAKLPLQRSCDGRCHHIRAGSGIKREYLNGRIIDFRQCRHRQLCIANNSDQEDG